MRAVVGSLALGCIHKQFLSFVHFSFTTCPGFFFRPVRWSYFFCFGFFLFFVLLNIVLFVCRVANCLVYFCFLVDLLVVWLVGLNETGNNGECVEVHLICLSWGETQWMFHQFLLFSAENANNIIPHKILGGLSQLDVKESSWNFSQNGKIEERRILSNLSIMMANNDYER